MPRALALAGQNDLANQGAQFDVAAVSRANIRAPSRPDTLITRGRPHIAAPGADIGDQIDTFDVFERRFPVEPVVPDEGLKLIE